MACLSAIGAFIDPARADLVAMLGETTGGPALVKMRDRMASNDVGRELLERRPRLCYEPIAVLERAGQLPEGSFGAAYLAYLRRYGFDPDERHEVHFVEDPELRWVLQRYREVHDLWHTLADLPPTVLGETAVKWLEMVQTGLPSAALSALVAPLRLPAAERDVLLRIYAPWAAQCGRGVDLLSVDYEALFSRPLDEVREMLRFTPAPTLSLSCKDNK